MVVRFEAAQRLILDHMWIFLVKACVIKPAKVIAQADRAEETKGGLHLVSDALLPR